jgi:L-iditol 2-dehydrogenase
MRAARLHGPADLRLDKVPHPGKPGRGEALVRVSCTGICGSDLHSFLDGRIGDTAIQSPLITGHEFAGVVEELGPESLDGGFQPLQPGLRVAVDPARPCGRCEFCEQGDPHLCPQLRFCGNYPCDGCLCDWIRMPARNCFPVPDTIDDAGAALLEPLGVALHAVDLAHLRPAPSVAVIGAGPIGLLILQIVKLAGADPIFVSDKFAWRLKLAERWGAIPLPTDAEAGVHRVWKETRNRGADVAIEAAWGDVSIEQAARLAKPGGRVVLVGIPSNDRLEMRHSTARRKGLTLLVSRRMKQTYPRAIQLAQHGRVDLQGLISHRFPLSRAAQAFALNAAYRDNVVKVIIDHPSEMRPNLAPG